MKKLLCLYAVLLFLSCDIYASKLIMVRSQQSFPEAMLSLQSSIADHGYKVSRVQRIDFGLTGKGYKTDRYRVVFVSKSDEFLYLIDKYPMLAAYLPPKVSIYAEGKTTMIVTANPAIFSDMVDEKDRILFKRWESDIYSVFSDVKRAE